MGSKAPSATQNGKPSTGIAGMQDTGAKNPMLILYGSNAGTCKGFAEEIKSNAGQHGFDATVGTMDSAVEQLPTDRPVIIITPSYEGKPADNAKKFVSWLENNAESSMLKDVKYSVFGAGNAEWHSTFHRIPKIVDELMEKMGGTHVSPAGYCNVNDDILGPWEDWLEKLWVAVQKDAGVTGVKEEKVALTVEKPDQVEVLAGSEAVLGTVKENRQIADTSVGSEKRHMEVELPGDLTYSTGKNHWLEDRKDTANECSPGDYLVVLPFNSPELVHRVVTRFAMHPDDKISVKGTNKAFLVGAII